VWLFGKYCSCTECVFGVNVVENPVRHELECILTRAAARLSIQHLQLRLALVELIAVTFLQGNACMGLVDGDCQIIPYALHLQAAAFTTHNQQLSNCWESRPLPLGMISNCSNLTAGSCVYHDSHCNIQPWARAAHPYCSQCSA